MFSFKFFSSAKQDLQSQTAATSLQAAWETTKQKYWDSFVEKYVAKAVKNLQKGWPYKFNGCDFIFSDRVRMPIDQFLDFFSEAREEIARQLDHDLSRNFGIERGDNTTPQVTSIKDGERYGDFYRKLLANFKDKQNRLGLEYNYVHVQDGQVYTAIQEDLFLHTLHIYHTNNAESKLKHVKEKLNSILTSVISSQNPLLILENMAEFAWLISQIMPYYAGTASIMEMAVSSLLTLKTNTLGCLKYNYDIPLDLVAIFSDLSIFKQLFVGLFDLYPSQTISEEAYQQMEIIQTESKHFLRAEDAAIMQGTRNYDEREASEYKEKLLKANAWSYGMQRRHHNKVTPR